MSARISDVFKQQRPGTEHLNSSRKASKELQGGLPGVSGAAAGFTDGDTPEEERVLRQFDLDTRYGPCAGMTRLERWARADKFGLNPPQQVKELLQRLEGEQWDKNIWDGRV